MGRKRTFIILDDPSRYSQHFTRNGETVVERALHEVRRFMADHAGPGVVAVSGGADSVALLRALHACTEPLTVAHVNHQLRGAESDADAAFVQQLCATLGVPCRVKTLDVGALAVGENLEATARRVRYEFFVQVAAEVGASWIATGHTADDQAETVLHRLVRGTGLQGLRGIAAVLANPSRKGGGEGNTPSLAGGVRPTIVRPLLTITRADVLAYLAALGQPFREDSSNADPRFTRNRVRRELLPLLKTFNPDVVSALAHLATHAAEAHEVLTALARDLLAKAERLRAGSTIILDAATLAAAPRAVVRVALRLVWEREGWLMSEMGFDAWDRAVEIACRAAGACDFPGGVSMRHAGRVVQLASRS